MGRKEIINNKVMPDKLLDSTHATVGGVATLGTTASIQLYEYFTMENINDFLEFGIAVAGAVFLCYKIAGQRLNNKGQQLDNEMKRKKLKNEADKP